MNFIKGNLIFSKLKGYNEVSVACYHPKEIIVVPETVIHEGRKYIVTEIGSCSTMGAFTQTKADKRYKTGVRETGTSIYTVKYNWRGVKKVYIPSTIRVINPIDNQSDSSTGEPTLESIVVGKPKFSLFQLFLEKKEWGKFMLPEGLQTIRDYAFKDCKKLTSITIPNTVKSIGKCAFYGCSSLKSITIPNSVRSIEEGAFNGCSSLTSIVIPDSVTSIGGFAFWGCKSLTSIVIPDSVTSIGWHAFSGCSSLTSIVIPDSVTSIGTGAFRACKSLTSIVLAGDNTVYDSRENCNAIIETGTNTLICGCQNTTIPDSVTSIGEEAFAGCSSLTSIVIPDSVKSIGERAFSHCSRLSSITIPNNVKSIEDGTFESCKSLTSIVIPDSVTSIGKVAFQYCSTLPSITIPDSVTSIEQGAFNDCDALTHIIIENIPKNIAIDNYNPKNKIKFVKKMERNH